MSKPAITINMPANYSRSKCSLLDPLPSAIRPPTLLILHSWDGQFNTVASCFRERNQK